MEDTQRGMAAEERKFSNTVVLTADKDTVVLGGRGTRRERKVIIFFCCGFFIIS